MFNLYIIFKTLSTIKNCKCKKCTENDSEMLKRLIKHKTWILCGMVCDVLNIIRILNRKGMAHTCNNQRAVDNSL